MFDIKFCRWLDSNHTPLELEVAALQTEPEPQPSVLFCYEGNIIRYVWDLLNQILFTITNGALQNILKILY